MPKCYTYCYICAICHAQLSHPCFVSLQLLCCCCPQHTLPPSAWVLHHNSASLSRADFHPSSKLDLLFIHLLLLLTFVHLKILIYCWFVYYDQLLLTLICPSQNLDLATVCSFAIVADFCPSQSWFTIGSFVIINYWWLYSKRMIYFQWLFSWLLHKWRDSYLVPNLAQKITCRRFDWMLQLLVNFCPDDNWSIQSKLSLWLIYCYWL